ncbi:hypothetical protein [Rhodoferax sp.]|uniref:hypothetical protein n=1 Tax=Rhodoferax sp. TaxID=50421 RepID=UPI0025DD8A1C|nr:hypothetical protein [Rhodoferax sp.]
MNRTTDSLYDICEHAIDCLCTTYQTDRPNLWKTFQSKLTDEATDGWPTSFTDLAVYIFYAVTHQLAPSFTVYSALKGNPKYFDDVKMHLRVLFNEPENNRKFFLKEYLVDFFAASNGYKLAPIATMESESKLMTNCKRGSADEKGWEFDPFHDFDKLLIVSSPRRVYFGHVSSECLAEYCKELSNRLDEAYRSQTVLRGDEVVVILLVSLKESVEIQLMEFESHRRMTQLAPTYP